jgi:hypothetical protein
MEPPRNRTFAAADWVALAAFWYPVAFSREVTTKPLAVRLLDERIALIALPMAGSMPPAICAFIGGHQSALA